MANLQVPPHTLQQKEILSLVEKLRKEDVSPFVIYEVV